MVVDIYNPSTGKAEAEGFLGTLVSQLVSYRLSERFYLKKWGGRARAVVHAFNPRCTVLVNVYGSCTLAPPPFNTDASRRHWRLLVRTFSLETVSERTSHLRKICKKPSKARGCVLTPSVTFPTLSK